MAFPPDYPALLDLLGMAFSRYREATGYSPILVGGAATAILTQGEFMSGDFDILAANDEVFEQVLLSMGFQHEDKGLHLLRSYFHPDFPAYGVEQVSGALFDGQTDQRRLLRFAMRDGEIVLPPFEDMIADRLGQHAVASASDKTRLEQARFLYGVAQTIDADYLKRRVEEEGGDISLLDDVLRVT